MEVHDLVRNMQRILLILLLLAAPGVVISGETFLVGTGRVDITPAEPVRLAGSPSPKQSSAVSSRLFVKALVIAAAEQRVMLITLDTLKYPVHLAIQARDEVERVTGIPAQKVVICSSHTHSGPLWSYYPDKLVTRIGEAAALAVKDLAHCRIGTAAGKVEGVSENRRVLIDGEAWNRWLLQPSQSGPHPAEGPADPAVGVLAAVGEDGRYKAVAFNFACHAANNRTSTISADFPGAIQENVEQQLGYRVPLFFLTGACGDVNPVYSVPANVVATRLSDEVRSCLGRLQFIEHPVVGVETRELAMPGRENPEWREADVAKKWPGQLEHYRKTFQEMQLHVQSSYRFFLSGIRLGDDFAIVTNPVELFCGIGMSIKAHSPFAHTLVVEQTNGAHGYVPTAEAFAGGSYETWFGEHSYLTTRAGELIEKESLDILSRLKDAQ